MILPKERDPRFITIPERGDAHGLRQPAPGFVGSWAAACAQHVLQLFESVQPSDPRPTVTVVMTRRVLEMRRACWGTSR
jgi:hypothetical protein